MKRTISHLILFLLGVLCVRAEPKLPKSDANVGSPRIAIIGLGVSGLSTAMAIKELKPDAMIRIYHQHDIEETVSFNIVAMFRIDNGSVIDRIYGRASFEHYADLWREYGGVTGVQMVSGHILSKDKKKLDLQWKNYGDIVYNYYNMTPREMKSQFAIENLDSYHAIHYTAYSVDGKYYLPWMKKQLEDKGGVEFVKKKIDNLDDELGDKFDVIIVCAGLGAKGLTNDVSLYPIRGMIIRTDQAPWQKSFLNNDFKNYLFPGIDHMVIGTIKEEHSGGLEKETEDDHKKDRILQTYYRVHPAFKDVKVRETYIGVRPGRFGGIRLEMEELKTKAGTPYKLVHNYGHAGNGFMLGWGTAMHAAKLALGMDVSEYPVVAPKKEDEKKKGEGKRKRKKKSNLVREEEHMDFLY